MIGVRLKPALVVFGGLMLASPLLASCDEEDPVEEMGDEIEEGAEEAGDAIEDATD